MTLEELKTQVAAGAINPGLGCAATQRACTLCAGPFAPVRRKQYRLYRLEVGYFRVCLTCWRTQPGVPSVHRVPPAGSPPSKDPRKRKLAAYKRYKADYSSEPTRHEQRALAAKQHQKAPRPTTRRFT